MLQGIICIVRGPVYREETIDSLYRHIIFINSQQQETEKLGYNWGYALVRLNSDDQMELLTLSGALNKNQTASVYGGSPAVCEEQRTGMFSASYSLLHQIEGGGLLRFENIQGEKSVTQITIEDEHLIEKKLEEDELKDIQPEQLKPVVYMSSKDYAGLKPLEDITIGQWYPDFPYKTQGVVQND